MTAEAIKYLDGRPLVFIVEDEKAYRSFLGNTLERYGYNVLMFEHGKQALAVLHYIIPDLILSDIDMPCMDGFEFQDTIKKQFKSFQIPLIYLTARKNSSDIKRAVELGSKGFLRKPAAPHTVIESIQHVLNKQE